MTLSKILIDESTTKDNNYITPWDVISDKYYNISANVHAETDTHYGVSAYFILYNNKDPYIATKACKICFKLPKYIQTVNGDYENWDLTKEEKFILINFLSKQIPSKLGGPDDSTVYKELIKHYNELVKCKSTTLASSLINDNNVPIDTPMPDYTKLSKYDDSENYNWIGSSLVLSPIRSISETI